MWQGRPNRITGKDRAWVWIDFDVGRVNLCRSHRPRPAAGERRRMRVRWMKAFALGSRPRTKSLWPLQPSNAAGSLPVLARPFQILPGPIGPP